MDGRLSLRSEAGELFRLFYDFDRKITEAATDLVLTELVRLRISQINGCEFCTTLHLREGARAGVTQEQFDSLAQWGDADCFDETQRAALTLAEALTILPSDGVDQALAEVGKWFSAKEVAHLVFVIGAINQWNRLMIAARV